MAVFQVPSGSEYGNFLMRDGDAVGAHPNYVTVADLTLRKNECLSGGAITAAYGEVAKSGAMGLRVVGNVFSASYDTNTMTGLLSIGNDASRIYGNEFKDTGTTPPINNNHTIYVQVGSSDVDIGWNHLHDLRMGHLIQVQTDTAFTYTNVRIHDNLLTASATSNSRGINIGNVQSGSNGGIYNNILSNLAIAMSPARRTWTGLAAFALFRSYPTALRSPPVAIALTSGTACEDTSP